MLDGFSKSSEYLERAKVLGMRGFGVTDHGNNYGVYDLITTARAMDLIGVPGCEFYVAPINPEGAKVQNAVYYGPGGQKSGAGDVSGNGAFLHLTVWAYTQEGMHNLFRLSTMSYDRNNYYVKPRIDFDMLADHSEGLIVSTGCPSGEISTRFRLGQDKAAYEYAGRLKDIFGDRLFVEIMDHSMSIDLERNLLPKQLELSKKMGIPLLATNDCHYAHAEDALHHEEMLCTQSGARMSDLRQDDGGNRFAFNGTEYYLKSSQQMGEIFPDRDFPGALSNTLLIAEMAEDITLDFDPSLKPKPIIPKEFKDDVEYYRHLIEVGFKDRYSHETREVREEAKKRIKNEFDVIHSSNFVGYMLTVREYISWTRNKYATRDETGNILALPVGGGRGSVGGSIHAYCLYISELCPIKHNLVFERFLSAGRGDTYRITYDDGSFEDIIVSDTKNVQLESSETASRYIHQLAVGDTVVD